MAMLDLSFPLHAPHGSELHTKGWLQEGALRCLLNNLDPDVAEDPENLIVYGGRGKAARNLEAFQCGRAPNSGHQRSSSWCDHSTQVSRVALPNT